MRAEYRHEAWVIVDSANPHNPIKVDQLLMDSGRYGEGYAEGVILVAHGIDMETVDRLPSWAPRVLGLGYLTRLGSSPKGTSRVRLVAGNSRPERIQADPRVASTN